VVGAIVAAWPIGAARAADPERALSQFLRDRWDKSSGFPGGQVYAITQARDGYLWVAAEKGLVRFDGLRFHLFQPLEPTSATDTAALNVLPDSDGALWTWLRRAALLRFRNGAFANALNIPGPPDPRVGAMAVGNDGAILIADARLGLLVSRSGRVHTLLARGSLPWRFITAVAQTPDGDIWVGTRDAGLVRVQHGQATIIGDESLSPKINCLVSDDHNRVWIGTDDGVFKWDAGVVTRAATTPEAGRVRALSMAKDRDANIWVGTADALLRIDSRGALSLERRGPSSPVTALFDDREGNLWVGDTGGIERWRDGAFTSFARVDSSLAGSLGPVFSDAADRVWFAPASGGLYWLRGGRVGSVAELRDDVIYSIAADGDAVVVGRQRGGVTRIHARGEMFTTETFTERDGLAQNQVIAVHRTRDGAVWAGTLSRGVSRLKDGAFTTYTTSDGLASNTVASLLETADGAVWFATPNGVSMKSPAGWRRYSTADGLPSNDINTLFEDSARHVWLGTAAGLAVMQDGRLHALPDLPAPLGASILGLTEDGAGGLWIAAADGVFRVDRERLLGGTLRDGDVREFSAADGLPQPETIKRHRVLTADSRGRLWLSTNVGLAMADGRRLAAGVAPALVQIEDVSADGSPVEQAPVITIPPRQNRITFGFAALSLAVPDRVRFRYRLDGFDRDWSAPVSERQAVFTNLGPGSYRFRVIASNSQGLWNGAEAALPFTIAPAWWQMASFWVAVAIVVTGGFGAAHRLRLRIVEKHEREISALNERLMKAQEQERIRIAGELHDGVMQEMLAVTMMLGTAKRRIRDDAVAKATIDKVQNKMIQVGTDIRRLSHDLHPPLLQQAGLPQAVQTYCAQFSTTSGIPVSCDADESAGDLSRGAALALYRIVQEALGNAAKHARATRISVRLTRSDGMVSLVVSDNGVGFDRSRLAASGGLGLIGMRERAGQLNGKFDVESTPGRGTTIRVVIPFR
ncbi:MAG TPA: two-component regulator propeller domain-containing protein, partial [Vicinamibacterales bacterium]|nr:two-component regulator propeller domain-containing protein [Vicinamibacterales bacterium]